MTMIWDMLWATSHLIGNAKYPGEVKFMLFLAEYSRSADTYDNFDFLFLSGFVPS